MEWNIIVKCRHCASELNVSFLDLGHAPPSNAYLNRDALNAPEIWFPLNIVVCDSCWLVQTEDYAGRESLFTSDYAYFSSFSSTWLSHAKHYVDDVVDRFQLTSSSTVVEIASNDGYLLQYVKGKGIPCYGIEPTHSTAESARSKGLAVVEEFFGRNLANQLVSEGRTADLMVANNVLAHVPDINDFLSGFSILLKQTGVATFEFPHLLNMLKYNQFDTAYHEHFSYLSLTALINIFRKNNLLIFDVEKLSTHGGSLRVFACRFEEWTSKIFKISPHVEEILNEEMQYGINNKNCYSSFQSNAQQIKFDFLNFLLISKRKGLSVAAYGAAAKGNTLLNYTGVKSDLIEYVCDAAPAKQGKFMPGNHIPIVNPKTIVDKKPDYLIIFPWNLKDELTKDLEYIRAWNGKFVTVIPELEIF